MVPSILANKVEIRCSRRLVHRSAIIIISIRRQEVVVLISITATIASSSSWSFFKLLATNVILWSFAFWLYRAANCNDPLAYSMGHATSKFPPLVAGTAYSNQEEENTIIATSRTRATGDAANIQGDPTANSERRGKHYVVRFPISLLGAACLLEACAAVSEAARSYMRATSGPECGYILLKSTQQQQVLYTYK